MSGYTRKKHVIQNKTRRITKKYVICIPQGGLCDMIARIYECLEYCKKHKRILIVDTRFSTHMKYSIFHYFKIDSPILFRGDFDKQYASLKGKSFFPSEFSNNFKTVECRYKKGIGSINKKTKTPCFIDLKKSYSEDVLLYRNSGGGPYYNISFLKICRLTPLVKKVFFERQKQLPEKYISVHIRNTDYKSDVDNFIKENKKIFDSNSIFLASDHYETIQKFKSLYGKHLFSFSKIKKIPKTNKRRGLHYMKRSLKETHEMTVDAIVDLLLLAGGTHLYFSSKESGYSKVADLLHKDYSVVKHLLSNN